MRDGFGSPQTVLVVGAASEIAQATARALARAGARSFRLAARRPESLAAHADELRALGASQVECVQFDADDLDAHERFADEAFGTGDVDVALLAFGVLGDPAHTLRDREAALAVLRTNTLGGASALLAIAERMRVQGHGALVVMSSAGAERARKSNAVYGASKAGLDALAQGLGDALAGSGVHVMVVRPGFVHTRMTAGLEAPPLSTSADAVADAIVRGLRRRAEVVWVPPAMRGVMSGLRHLPRPLYRRLDI
jgi:decaprenylphospho-beta-D-erythro-pentofuranosid-2-ulose 2-reductase